MFNYTIRSGSRLLRCGFTTGTCAALAAAGATELLLTGHSPKTIGLITPKGLPVQVELQNCRLTGDSAFCAVQKDAGDDPDVTDGILICVTVHKTSQGIEIEGGTGIGRVTRPGLDQPCGAAAINSVPRRMILKAVENVCAEQGYAGGLAIIISAPEGEAIARKTFNPELGITGGISILGTSGIVEPMSEQAIVDTIALEQRQARLKDDRLLLVPGNYGLEYVRRELPQLEGIPVVKSSNFIGDAIDLAVLNRFQSVLVIGHIGKLIKLAGGIMNTHSRLADCRCELICAHAAIAGASTEVCQRLMEQVTADGCLEVLAQAGLREAGMSSLLSAIERHLMHRAGEALKIGAVTFSNLYGTLGMTAAAHALIQCWGGGAAHGKNG